MSLVVVILAGGESRRMGRDKALLEVAGQTLLARTAETARRAGLPALIVGRSRPAGWARAEVSFVVDETPLQGPLAGLTTALRLGGGSALALACDMPGLTAAAVTWLCEACAAHPEAEHGVVTLNQGQREPLFAVYHPACLPLAEERLASGRRSLNGLIESAHFASVPAPDWLVPQLVNVNTPEELERWERRA